MYKCWKRACKNLDIVGVDLYAGTKHSSTTALAKIFTPEQIKSNGTLHNSNKAFERYFQVNPEGQKEIYQATRKSWKAKKSNMVT